MMFYEEQRFSPWIIGLALVLVCATIPFVLMAAPPDVAPEEQSVAVWSLTIPIGLVVALFLFFKLVTRVQPGRVEFGFPLGLRRRIAADEIERAEVVQYRPLRDFGGWGLRFGREGMMYNARGNAAVRLRLKSGKVVFVGSGRAEELASAIDAARRAPQPSAEAPASGR